LFPFGDEFLLAGGVLFLGDQFADLVLPLLDLLHQVNKGLAGVVDLNGALGVGVRDVAVDTVRFNGVEVGADEGGVEHGSILETVRDASQKRSGMTLLRSVA